MLNILLATALSLSTAHAGTLDADAHDTLRALAAIAESHDAQASPLLEVDPDGLENERLLELSQGEEVARFAVYTTDPSLNEALLVSAGLLLEGKRDIGTGAHVTPAGKRDIGTGARVVEELQRPHISLHGTDHRGRVGVPRLRRPGGGRVPVGCGHCGRGGIGPHQVGAVGLHGQRPLFRLDPDAWLANASAAAHRTLSRTRELVALS